MVASWDDVMYAGQAEVSQAEDRRGRAASTDAGRQGTVGRHQHFSRPPTQ